MHVHSKRWEMAQDIERIYWKKDFFRESEFKELLSKYSKVFGEVESRYGFSRDTKILDLGCGATCPSVLFTRGVKYGVDPLAKEFLEKDREKLSGKIRLLTGSGENIPFADGFFDVVLCRNALDHMDNVDQVMREIKRVVKDKGLVILSIYTYTPFITFLKKTSEVIPFLRNVEHPFTFTPVGFGAFCRRFFETLEERVVFEGTSSVDYGKEDVEMTEPLLHKIFAWSNRRIFMNKWFLRELMVVCRKK
ncbi:MAG: hypothetical protein BMS9Abin23_1093 [Thermodesulfobacteriota bacterium]|nr:MAG: hypothetical protein BMS9Abin23_1093 [Thermodesulfobacteriota bacterium]